METAIHLAWYNEMSQNRDAGWASGGREGWLGSLNRREITVDGEVGEKLETGRLEG